MNGKKKSLKTRFYIRLSRKQRADSSESEKKAVFFSYLGFILLYVALFTFLAVYTLSLKTIRIGFLDVRDVDKVLEYFVEQIGFKPPKRVGEHLLFRAKPMTILMWNVFKIKATINGNTIILTGPLRMVMKVKKQIASFVSKE